MQTRDVPRQRYLRSPAGRRLVLQIVVGFTLLGSSVGCIAAEWTLRPEVVAAGRYEDNPRLSESGDENDIYGGSAELSLTGARRTERSSLLFRPRLSFERYDDSDQDSSDQFLDVFASTRGQRGEFRFFGNVSHEQVLRGEVSTVDFSEGELDETDDSNSGRVNQRRDRFRWRVRPGYSYDLTERTRIGTSAQYIDVKYNNEAPGEALDYTDATVELFVGRDLSERKNVRLIASASRYKADQISNDSKSYGARVRYQSETSETFSWYAEGGAERTDVQAGDNDEVDDTTTSYVFVAGTVNEWERTRLQTEAKRSLDPSGTGFLQTRDGVKVNLRHRFKPRWSGEIGVYAFREDNVDDTLETNKRDYVRGLVKIAWQLRPAWSIEGGYVYTYQDYDNTPGHADSNEFLLGVRYKPLPRRWSR